ncbi:UNVERIFIED_CONTAM: hypothetical protein N8J90_01425 [Halobacillus marinus]|uniref:hypothetical protein n=1 Tax=Bacillus sp. SB49 TaxID=1071080 RepID=UPI000417C8EA|nr:hypothetical protein [Bacillus sp. SB49]QHT46432.1 hypothetical protein M662_07980 [Bacillus sp. SB49]
MGRYQAIIWKAAVFFFYLWLVSFIQSKLQTLAAESFIVYPYIIFGQTAYIPAGFLLKFEKITQWRKKDVLWRWNRKGVGVITLCLYFLFVPFVLPLPALLPGVLVTNPSASPVVQMVAGYAAAACFLKERR